MTNGVLKVEILWGVAFLHAILNGDLVATQKSTSCKKAPQYMTCHLPLSPLFYLHDEKTS